MQRSRIPILICLYLTSHDVELLFMRFLATHLPILVTSVQISSPVLGCVVCFLAVEL